MNRNTPPSFADYERGPDFDRARSQIATPFQYLDIALDTAASNQIYNVSGDFLYLDAAFDGTVTIELNNEYSDPAAPFLVTKGWAFAGVFKQLKISWSAQSGKKVRLMYSTGQRVVPTNSMAISGAVNINDIIGSGCQHLYDTSTPALNYVVRQLVNPTSNTNGMTIRGLDLNNAAGAGGYIESYVMASATAPTDVTSRAGTISLISLTNNSTTKAQTSRGVMNRKLPAGWGVWAVSYTATAVGSQVVSMEFEL